MGKNCTSLAIVSVSDFPIIDIRFEIYGKKYCFSSGKGNRQLSFLPKNL